MFQNYRNRLEIDIFRICSVDMMGVLRVPLRSLTLRPLKKPVFGGPTTLSYRRVQATAFQDATSRENFHRPKQLEVRFRWFSGFQLGDGCRFLSPFIFQGVKVETWLLKWILNGGLSQSLYTWVCVASPIYPEQPGVNVFLFLAIPSSEHLRRG